MVNFNNINTKWYYKTVFRDQKKIKDALNKQLEYWENFKNSDLFGQADVYIEEYRVLIKEWCNDQ